VVDIASGSVLEGGDEVSPWAERLVFERRSGLQSDPLKGGMAHLCPACMAAASVDDGGRCRECGAHVTDGDHDWVVTAVEAID
jgi:hypothetical protein